VGTYLIQGKDFTLKVIDEALASGYRLFDTAHMYSNEGDLGAAFKELLPKHNLKREDIFITTKFVPSVNYKTEEDYLKLVQESLKNLQTNYLDLMLLHWPGVYGLSNHSKEVIRYRHNAWKALSKFHKEGLIRNIGVSNFLIKHLVALKKECDVVPVLNQVEWHPKCFDMKLLDYCKKNNILLQAYSSLGTTGDLSLRNDITVKKIAKKLKKSPSQILLKWANLKDVAIIPKASSRSHLVENISLYFEIPEEDVEVLDAINADDRFDWNPNDII
jgi:diketogulonate reductase-like aldo/keto reductase